MWASIEAPIDRAQRLSTWRRSLDEKPDTTTQPIGPIGLTHAKEMRLLRRQVLRSGALRDFGPGFRFGKNDKLRSGINWYPAGHVASKLRLHSLYGRFA